MTGHRSRKTNLRTPWSLIRPGYQGIRTTTSSISTYYIDNLSIAGEPNRIWGARYVNKSMKRGQVAGYISCRIKSTPTRAGGGVGKVSPLVRSSKTLPIPRSIILPQPLAETRHTIPTQDTRKGKEIEYKERRYSTCHHEQPTNTIYIITHIIEPSIPTSNILVGTLT